MVHGRADYNRIQDPALDNPALLSPGSTAIAADEPVMLFRAQNSKFIPVLEAYLKMLRDDYELSGPQYTEQRRSIRAHIELAEAWQQKNGSKTADIPLEEAQ